MIWIIKLIIQEVSRIPPAQNTSSGNTSPGNTSSSGQQPSTGSNNPAIQRILTAYELVVKTPTNAGTGETIRVPNVGSFCIRKKLYWFP